MDEMTIQEMGQRLARDLSEVLPSRRTKLWGYPKDLKSQVIPYVKVCRERDETVGDLSGRLGLVESTLVRWLRRDRRERGAGFRSVAIVSGDNAVQEEERGGLRLTTPHGYHADSLDPRSLAKGKLAMLWAGEDTDSLGLTMSEL